MSQNFQIIEISPTKLSLVPFGPIEYENGLRLFAPESVSAKVLYPTWDCSLELFCYFQGSRLDLQKIVIEANKPKERSINSSLTQNLEISKVMRELSLAVFPQAEIWADRSSQDEGPRISSEEFLAQLYWFENATWGKPRQTLMNYMNWSRTNANWHIKRLAKIPHIGMPSLHSHNSEVARQSKRQRDEAI